ncbi:hypothetical protein M569_15633, partial [Genlisea aurea]
SEMALRMWASSTANALKISISASSNPRSCFSTVLEGLKYSNSHEWVKHDGPISTIGITDHAQGHLGDVVFVELPEAGKEVTAGKGFGAVESVKATSDINSPISGEIVEVNDKLAETPGLINQSPYGDGWMIKVKASDSRELDSLLDPKAYTKLCEEEDASH